jgi:hypothetical protein
MLGWRPQDAMYRISTYFTRPIAALHSALTRPHETAGLLGWRIIFGMPQTRLTPTLISPNSLIWVLMGSDRGFVVESRERFPLDRSAPGLSDFTCTTAPLVLSDFSKSKVTGELFE